jgi:deoxyribonuclease-4
VCFDTAHVFASGYDLRGYDGYCRTLDEFDEIIGLERVRVIHINDSKAPLGSRVDRHTSLGRGHLGLQVFHAFARDQRFSDTPMILENPDRDNQTMADMCVMGKLLATKDDLTEVPPGAQVLPLWAKP